jgi:hypothetical protein
MEAARTSETSVDNYFTRQYIPEDKSELYTRRRENLKSHTLLMFSDNCQKLDAFRKYFLGMGKCVLSVRSDNNNTLTS